MMLILGLGLSIFLGFKAAMTMTTLAVVAHLVGHGLLESRSVDREESPESLNDATPGKPGA